MNPLLVSPATTCLRICLPPGYSDPGTQQGLEFIAKELAVLMGLPEVKMVDSFRPEPGRRSYALPPQTLTREQARALDIHSAADLYGGVVPHAFLVHKTAAHPLPEPGMAHPEGWQQALGLALRKVVLPGFSVFSGKDALHALSKLQQAGYRSLRIKLASANAGRGQGVVASRQELERLLDQFEWRGQLQHGVVLEENLPYSHTFSVGQADVGGSLISYIGQQHATVNHLGEKVYGGSTLLAARGGYEQLLKVGVVQNARSLIDVAARYEHAFFSAFPGLYASRRNYDVILGINMQGVQKLGVLEHSWRCGGASVAEVLALRTLQRNPHLSYTYAWTRERYVEQPDKARQSPYLYSLAPDHHGYLAKFGGPR